MIATWKKLALTSFAALLLACGLLPGTTRAQIPYPNYFISPDGFYLKVPAPYIPDGYISLEDAPEGGLKKAQDLFIGKDNRLYVADTENKRVLKLDANGNVLHVFGTDGKEGDPARLQQPKGVYVDANGIVYVVDAGNGRIVEYDKEGNLKQVIGKPESPLLGSKFTFQPSKIMIDSRQYFYIVNQGDQRGLMMLDPEGQFRGYFGGNRVQATFATRLIRLLYDKNQRAGSFVNLPYSFNNVVGSSDGYIYATTTGLGSKQLRKLNAVGGDIFPNAARDFSDESFSYSDQQQNFTDVAVDNEGNMTIIDKTFGRMYQYDESGRLLFAFGSNGPGEGTFGSVSSLAVDGNGELFVLDETRGVIHKFKPTAFADVVHHANHLYNQGKYEDSFVPWKNVRQDDNFYELALQAMGQTKLRQEEYADAMVYFKQAYDKSGYSDAFFGYRREYIKRHFNTIATTVIIASVLLYASLKLRRGRKTGMAKRIRAVGWLRPAVKTGDFLSEAFWVMTHPFQGFEALRYEDKGRWGKALALVLLYVAVSVLGILLVSFTYEDFPIQFVDWYDVVLYPILYWVLFSAVNYALTTITDGEGRWRDVFIATAYCFTPYIFFSLPITLLTHLMTLREAGFHSIFEQVLLVWVVFLLYVNVRETNSYDTGKAVGILALTGAGCVVLLGLYLVLYGLGLNLIDFAQQVAKEAFYVGS